MNSTDRLLWKQFNVSKTYFPNMYVFYTCIKSSVVITRNYLPRSHNPYDIHFPRAFQIYALCPLAFFPLLSLKKHIMDTHNSLKRIFTCGCSNWVHGPKHNLIIAGEGFIFAVRVRLKLSTLNLFRNVRKTNKFANHMYKHLCTYVETHLYIFMRCASPQIKRPGDRLFEIFVVLYYNN